MKYRLYYTAIFVCLLTLNVNGQISKHTSKKLISEFGIIGGLGLCSLRGNSSVDNNSQNSREVKMSKLYGLVVGHKFTDAFSITSGFFIDKKGGASKTTAYRLDEELNDFVPYKIDVDYNYTTTPYH